MHSPNDAQRLSVEDRGSSNDKPHKKKHHSDPGGESCSSVPEDEFMLDGKGSSRSESDLGGNEIITPSSSSCSSASSETSTRATQTHCERHQLKLILECRGRQGSRHVRTSSSGSLTSGATPHRYIREPIHGKNSILQVRSQVDSDRPSEILACPPRGRKENVFLQLTI